MRRMIVSALVLAALALIAAVAAPATAALDERRGTERLALDIAEDATRFVFDQDVATAEGMPAAGSAFITHGYLYPAGTLTCSESGCNGVNPDGTPEFPDRVVGAWICEGYFIQDYSPEATGPIVITTQLYQLGVTPGAQTVVTQGYELADLDVMVSRAILGGSGDRQEARGEQRQELLGLNQTMGVTMHAELEIRNR